MLAFLLTLLAVPASADSSLLAARPSSALVDEIIELRPAAGHHFNVEAPQSCGGEKPLEVLPRRLRCQLTKPGTAAVRVSVCDDALTFCRQETFDVAVAGPSSPSSKAARRPAPAAPRARRGAPEGFLDNRPGAARARARREGRLLLIDFYAVWCPPCNQLEELAYPDPAFRAASAGFVKVGLDADAPESFDWKAHFKVGGYPTLIVADAGLREIARLVGSRSGPALAKFLKDADARRKEPLDVAAALVAKDGPEATDERRSRVAHWRVARGELAAAEPLLAGLTGPGIARERVYARYEKARLEDDDAGRLAATKELIRDDPGEPDFAAWAAELAAADKLAAEPLRAAVRGSVAAWSTSAALGESDWTPPDLLSEEAAFVAELGSTEEAKGLWSRAADAYAAEALKSPLAVPRAANIGRADALMKAGRAVEAKALYESLVKAYPGEFTFNFEYASALKEAGDPAAAYPYAAAAADDAYGDNWLRAARLKASLELALGRPADAAKTVDDALSGLVLPKSPAVRTGRYVAELRALRREIAAP